MAILPSQRDKQIPKSGSVSFDYEIGERTTPATRGELFNTLVEGLGEPGFGSVVNLLIKPLEAAEDLRPRHCNKCDVLLTHDAFTCTVAGCDGLAVTS